MSDPRYVIPRGQGSKCTHLPYMPRLAQRGEYIHVDLVSVVCCCGFRVLGLRHPSGLSWQLQSAGSMCINNIIHTACVYRPRGALGLVDDSANHWQTREHTHHTPFRLHARKRSGSLICGKGATASPVIIIRRRRDLYRGSRGDTKRVHLLKDVTMFVLYFVGRGMIRRHVPFKSRSRGDGYEIYHRAVGPEAPSNEMERVCTRVGGIAGQRSA